MEYWHLTDIIDWTGAIKNNDVRVRVFPSREWAISRVSRGAVPTLLFSPRVLTFTKLSFSRICSLITALAILCNILFLTAHIVSLLLLIDWEWTQECAFHCVSPEPILDFWGLYAELSRPGGGGCTSDYERMNEKHLSVFHSISHRARGKRSRNSVSSMVC